MTDTAVEQSHEDDDSVNEEDVSQWQFIEPRTPTAEAIKDLLTGLPKIWGVEQARFIDWVQPLPQTMTINKRQESGAVTKQKVQAYTLYTSVAGRIKMLNEILAENNWRAEFVPEPHTPSGIPGILAMEDAIVYREYLVITDAEGNLVGRRPGMAWVPSSGQRQNAAQTNPFEKVETAARGRALGAWGIGILPGSGIATVEEMTGARENEAALARQERRQQYGPGGSVPGGPPLDRASILQACQQVIEELRVLRGQTTEESNKKVAEYLEKALGVKNSWDDELKIPNWKNVNPGQLALLLPKLRENLQKEQNERKTL